METVDINTPAADDIQDDTLVPTPPVTVDATPADDITDTSSQASSDLATLMAIEKMLKNNISRTEELKADLKESSEMLKNAFDNSEEFREVNDRAKVINKEKSIIKKEILKAPEVAALSVKVQSLRSELKDLREGMSDYLRQFQTLSGVDEIEGVDGEVRQIVYVAKLIKKPSKIDFRRK